MSKEREKLEAAIREAFEAGWRRCAYYREAFPHTKHPTDCKVAFEDWKEAGHDTIAYSEIVELVNKHFWELLA